MVAKLVLYEYPLQGKATNDIILLGGISQMVSAVTTIILVVDRLR